MQNDPPNAVHGSTNLGDTPLKKKDATIPLEILYKELDRVYSSLNNHFSLLIQLLLITTTLIGGLVIYIYSNHPQAISLTYISLIFISPLIILGFYGAALILLYQMGLYIYHIRDISDQIKTKINGEFVLFFDANSFPSGIQSFLRGDTTFNFVRGGVIFIASGLFLSLISFSFYIVYDYNHFWGVIFLVTHSFGLIYLAIGVFGAFVELSKLHKEYIYRSTVTSKKENTVLKINKSIWGRIPRIILPRPLDFFEKSFILFIGVGIALFENKVPCLTQSNIVCLPEFREIVFSQPFPSDNFVFALYIIFWFAIQELFVQQSKYLWNDIRDQNSNNLIPANKRRPITLSGVNKYIYLELLLKWVTGLTLGYLLSFKLFVILVIFSLMQIVYEFWGKPNSNKYPLAPLFVVSVGSLLRFISGAYAVGWDFSDIELWKYSLIMLSIGVTTGAVMWKAEAKYMLINKKTLPRGQSKYFLENGQLWLLAGWCYCSLVFVMIIIDNYKGYSASLFARNYMPSMVLS